MTVFSPPCRAKLLALLWIALVLAGCGGEQPVLYTSLPRDATVLVVGDSLVAGTGAPRGQSWPDELARRTGWSVINAGVPGNTSADAYRRLPELLDTHRPDAVIIAIGGNDFLRSVPLETTSENVAAIVVESRAATGHVALVAIPAMSVGGALVGRLSDHDMFARIAQEHALAFVPAAVSHALSRAELRADRIHANADGYAHIAQGVVEALARHGWLAR